MSRLYDSVVHKSNPDLSHQANVEGDRWYISKPVPGPSFSGLKTRIRDAIRVLRQQAFAVHYATDSTETFWK